MHVDLRAMLAAGPKGREVGEKVGNLTTQDEKRGWVSLGGRVVHPCRYWHRRTRKKQVMGYGHVSLERRRG
eukprot:549229-Prorocentrum_minimum.AAC.2